jgi:hypothetical protein
MPGSRRTVEQNASLLIHEVSHLLRAHEERRKAAGIGDERRWNTAGDCEINDDLHAEGLPLPEIHRCPARMDCRAGTRPGYYKQLPASPPADRRAAVVDEQQPSLDCGSGAHGERRFWELPADEGADDGARGGQDQGRARAARGCGRIGGLFFLAMSPMPGGAGPRDPRAEGGLWPRSATSHATLREYSADMTARIQVAASPASLLRRIHRPASTSAAAADS